jgi:hypothetical protein
MTWLPSIADWQGSLDGHPIDWHRRMWRRHIRCALCSAFVDFHEKPPIPTYTQGTVRTIDADSHGVENLILVCLRCSERIAQNPSEYPPSRLRELRAAAPRQGRLPDNAVMEDVLARRCGTRAPMVPLWIATIRPSFDASLAIGSASMDDGRHCAAVLMNEDDAKFEPVVFAKDPVVPVLQSFDLVEDGPLVLDGISYVFFLQHRKVTQVMELSNPRGPHASKLIAAWMEVATVVADAFPDRTDLRDAIAKWHVYLH